MDGNVVLVITSLANKTMPPTPFVIVFSMAITNMRKSVVHKMMNSVDMRRWKSRDGPG